MNQEMKKKIEEIVNFLIENKYCFTVFDVTLLVKKYANLDKRHREVKEEIVEIIFEQIKIFNDELDKFDNLQLTNNMDKLYNFSNKNVTNNQFARVFSPIYKLDDKYTKLDVELPKDIFDEDYNDSMPCLSSVVYNIPQQINDDVICKKQTDINSRLTIPKSVILELDADPGDNVYLYENTDNTELILRNYYTPLVGGYIAKLKVDCNFNVKISKTNLCKLFWISKNDDLCLTEFEIKFSQLAGYITITEC